MILNNDELLEGFFQKIKEKYPNLTKEELKAIVDTPFSYAKKVMSSGSFETIHFKYLGKFKVYEKSVQGRLSSLEEAYKKGLVKEEHYKERKSTIKKYIDAKEIHNRDS